MDHDLTLFQWFALWSANWATAFCYTYLPLHNRATRSAAGTLSTATQRRFDAFVFCCGLHHWLHPVGMYFGWWWSIIAVDWTMASVSVAAAYHVYNVTRPTHEHGGKARQATGSSAGD